MSTGKQTTSRGDKGDPNKDRSENWDKGDWGKGWSKVWDKGDWDKGGWLKADWGAYKYESLETRRSAIDIGGRTGRKVVATGWHPDLPDYRDLTIKHEKITGNLNKVGSQIVKSKFKPPAMHSNINHCSPIEDQGSLGSCSAQAVVGLMEYMMRRSGTDHIDGSRLFVYKTTRNLMGLTGDSGAYLRTAMQAVVTFGIPPEKHWPYDISKFEEEPSAFLYSYASNYQALDYTRLDPPSYVTPQEVLELLKKVLASGYCVVFGFSVYSSISNAPDICFPTQNDTLQGGHAVMAVGYDDNHKVDGKEIPSLIIRNSWGKLGRQRIWVLAI